MHLTLIKRIITMKSWCTMEKTKDLEYKKIPGLLISLALPAIVAQLINIIYNLVDRIYIGQMVDGNIAMASLGVALPIITFIMAFTQLFGNGGSFLAAIKIGQNDSDGAENIMTNSFVLLISSGIIITIIILLFNEPLLLLFGANAQTLPMAIEYITIYSLGTIFVQIAMGMNSYINTQGFAKIGMKSVLIGALLNIILDPIFIFGFDMGVKGAALATIISQGVSCVWVLSFLFGEKSTIKIRRKYFKLNFKIVLGICALGLSPFIMSSTESLVQIVFNSQLEKYGGTLAVGAMIVILSVYQLVTLPLHGITHGAQPIISYNYGAKNYVRVREAIKLSFIISFAYSIIVSGFIILFAPYVTGLFVNDPDTLIFTTWAVRIYIIGGMSYGAQMSCQHAFMALGKAKISVFMAIFRKLILLIPFIYLFPLTIGNTQFAIDISLSVASFVHDAPKVFAIFFAGPVSDIIAAIVTTITFYIFLKRHLKKDLYKVLDSSN